MESKDQMGKTVLLILDEAHLLQTGPLEELRLLTNFKMDSYDPFILVLSGPDGHFKIPHLWPGQNPPPEVRSYPLSDRAK